MKICSFHLRTIADLATQDLCEPARCSAVDYCNLVFLFKRKINKNFVENISRRNVQLWKTYMQRLYICHYEICALWSVTVLKLVTSGVKAKANFAVIFYIFHVCTILLHSAVY